MRYGFVLLVLLLAACGNNDGMTRNYGTSRDTAPETIAATQTPLSMPPDFQQRPRRPGALPPTSQGNAQQADQSAGSAGQDAFLEAAGPSAGSDVRHKIDENSGLVYPAPEFVDRVMNWTPSPGYAPLTAPASKGWFSGWF